MIHASIIVDAFRLPEKSAARRGKSREWVTSQGKTGPAFLGGTVGRMHLSLSRLDFEIVIAQTRQPMRPRELECLPWHSGLGFGGMLR
jgi:hypothetical protein